MILENSDSKINWIELFYKDASSPNLLEDFPQKNLPACDGQEGGGVIEYHQFRQEYYKFQDLYGPGFVWTHLALTCCARSDIPQNGTCKKKKKP